MITVINMESLTKLTSERFYQLCLGNPDIPMERSAQGELIIIWNSLTEEEKRQFPPICPDFVIELRSQSDRLNSPSFSFRTNSAP
jgi:Uma2 family endonuclease